MIVRWFVPKGYSELDVQRSVRVTRTWSVIVSPDSVPVQPDCSGRNARRNVTMDFSGKTVVKSIQKNILFILYLICCLQLFWIQHIDTVVSWHTKLSYFFIFTYRCTCQNDAICDAVNGACTCLDGWYGENCHIPCPRGFYGQGCLHSCGIKPTETRKKCDPQKGTQTCIAGYRGAHCQFGCDPFWYGEECISRCTCIKENTQKCDPQKGLCICQPGFRGQKYVI